ncbi:transposase, IS605 OrfB [Pyrobaculum islandicum DSM 4184]|uniref:Transposase, IS605 OrfB n=1 Tax=Pyrobaculum islandicum (strain DSM 4184 / JCM 9189 / GEO3) TaxID=384616 RepID=A1RQF7_PYRIL|nr:zinc ribbon domain-containing protein [Pyrobaculum islandicum]ABL87189.1 transposase, IS605 OrfB [Pyrobaculum islandicum DSM 4184]
MYAYRTLKVEIPWKLIEERPDVLDLVTRMHLAAEEYVKRLLKELTGQEEPRLTAEELDRHLTPDRRELAHRIIEEIFPKYGLGRALVRYAKFLWHDTVFQQAIPLSTQLRVENEKDMSRAVFVDLKSGVLRVRKLGIPPFAVELKKGSISWIRERLQEGAKLKLAYLGVDVRRGKDPTYGGLYIALVFAREVAPVEPKALVVVDVNRLDHYVKVGLVADGRVVELLKFPKKERIRKLEKIHAHISQLSRALARVDEDRDPRRALDIQRQLWKLETKRYGVIRDVVINAAREIIKLAREHQAAVVVDAVEDDTYRELKERGGNGVKKHFLDGLGQLRRRLQALAQWYGLPYVEERLYSTICPKCGAKMEELRNRRMHCPSCGFGAHRDNVPMIWAEKKYQELIEKTKQPTFPTPNHHTFNLVTTFYS